MEVKQIKKSQGAASTIILILGALLLIVVVIVFFVLKTAATKKTAEVKKEESTTVAEPPKPVYETTIGDVRFILKSAQDLGNTIVGTYQGKPKSLVSTEKYIKVVIGAQNKGKFDLDKGSWGIGRIVDSDGRYFVSVDDQARWFLPNPNLCGILLKPEFEPIDCMRLYEVSKGSTSLKVEVIFTKKGAKPQTSLMDLLVE